MALNVAKIHNKNDIKVGYSNDIKERTFSVCKGCCPVLKPVDWIQLLLFSILRKYSFLICHACLSSYFILYFKSETAAFASIKSVIFPPKTRRISASPRHISSYLPIIVECCWTAASKSLSSMVHSPIAAHPQTLIQIQGKTWIFPPIVRRYRESAWMSCASCGSADAGRCHTSPRLPVWSGVM